MRVEIYPYNVEKILKAANALNVSPTDMINQIIDSVNIITKVEIEKVDLKFHKAKIESNQNEEKPENPGKAKRKPGGGNFVSRW